MNELFLYDRDNGLFKEILLKSSVIQGRYFILPDGASDINTSNFSQYIADVLTGIQNPAQKYPCALLMPPRSLVSSSHEVFSFTLLFLTRADYTGQNQLKQTNTAAQVSSHHAWYDWKDMREVAVQFLTVLHDVIRDRTIEINNEAITLRGLVHLNKEPQEVRRISLVGNDKVSGVTVNFRVEISRDCATSDYPVDVVTTIDIPSPNIHPIHKH